MDPQHLVQSLLDKLGARAAGLWRLRDGHLAQLAFAACDDMPAEVAAEFAGATRLVPMGRTDLGIVLAAVSGAFVASTVDDADAAAGSVRWLRAFGAKRSVAVPVSGADGASLILSVALGPDDRGHREISAIVAGHWSTADLDGVA